jgi:hypothetical protein
MGGTAVRAAVAIGTGGASELSRKKPFQPGGANDIKTLATQSALGPYGSTALTGANTYMASTAAKPIPPLQKIKTALAGGADIEAAARQAANQRKRDYQNLGRSSTLLTGPGGLGGTGSGSAKTLLGM